MSIQFLAGPKVALKYSADQWELYDLPGRDEAADALNRGMEALIEATPVRQEIRYEKLLSKYSEFGAADSEGYSMAEHILEMVYP